MFNLANVTFDKVKIRDLVESQYAGEWGDESYFPNANVIRATEIKNDGEINYSTAVKRKIDPQQLERKKLHCGDILVEGSGGSPTQPVGRIAYFNKNSDENFICSNFFRVIRLKSNINSKYIFWLLHYIYFQPIIMRFQQQTTGLINFKFQEYLDLEISVPSNPKDQEYIATVLDNLQNLINLQKDIISKLVSKKQGLLNDLLTRGVDSHGNLRPSYEDAPDLYQETELGFIPKEWEICGLHDIQRADKPVLKTGPFGSALKSEHWRESGHPVITIGSLGVNTIIESELLYIDDLTFNGLSTYLVEGGDIIFSRVADVGRCLIVQEHHKDWVMSSNLMRISVDKKIFKPELLTFILSSSSSLRKQIRKLVNSAGRDVANGEVLMKLKFAKPPVEEQVKIINIVERMNMAIDQELEQLNKLSNIKTGLLKDLLQN
jgi:type I restriction enzyme S subunit